MKLKSYQPGGGLVYTPFIPEQYVNKSTSKSSSSEDSETSKLDPLDKELLSLMKDQNLLPSDVNKIYAQIIAFQRRTQNLTDLGGSTSYRSVMPGMLQIMQLVQNAKYNKLKSDEAIKQMTSQNAGADVALDKYGRMYVQDSDGKIKHIAPSEYDDEKYRPISNSELLYLRENSLPFDTDILSDITQTVGLSDISKEINRIIKDFGKTSSERYYDKETVKMFTALNSPDGIYELMEKKSSADLRKAWNVIYKQLPTKMQHVLNARAALSDSNPVDYIHEIVLSNLDYEQQINYDATQSKAAGFDTDPLSTEKEGSKKTVKDTYAERLVSGDGLDPEQWINIMPTNTGVVLKAYSQNAGPLMQNGNRLYNTNLQVALSKSDAVGGIVDAQSVTFGDQLINTNDFTRIMVNNYVNMKRVYLPIKYTDDGRITPNFEAQQKLEMIQDKLKNEQYSEAWIDQWLKENLPEAKYNKETKNVEFDMRFVRPFLVLNGIAAKNRVEFNPDSQYLHHMNSDEGKNLKDEYERVVSQEFAGDKMVKTDNSGAGRRKYYSGNIYLPISGQVIGAAIYNNQYFNQDTYTDITQKARANEARQNMITNF